MKTLKLIPVILFALLLVISQAHAQKKNDIDSKLDRYEKVTKKFCELMNKQNEGQKKELENLKEKLAKAKAKK
jgi:hypothetical protein